MNAADRFRCAAARLLWIALLAGVGGVWGWAAVEGAALLAGIAVVAAHRGDLSFRPYAVVHEVQPLPIVLEGYPAVLYYLVLCGVLSLCAVALARRTLAHLAQHRARDPPSPGAGPIFLETIRRGWRTPLLVEDGRVREGGPVGCTGEDRKGMSGGTGEAGPASFTAALEHLPAAVAIPLAFFALGAFQAAYSSFLYVVGVPMGVPSAFAGWEPWHHLFFLANASVYEEVAVRLIYIGVPLTIRDIVARARPPRGGRLGCLRSPASPAWRPLLGGWPVGSTEAVLLLLSSALFGLAHVGSWGWWKFLPTFVAGLAFGLLYLRWGLPGSVLLHFVIDYLDLPFTLAGAYLPASACLAGLAALAIALGGVAVGGIVGLWFWALVAYRVVARWPGWTRWSATAAVQVALAALLILGGRHWFTAGTLLILSSVAGATLYLALPRSARVVWGWAPGVLLLPGGLWLVGQWADRFLPLETGAGGPALPVRARIADHAAGIR